MARFAAPCHHLPRRSLPGVGRYALTVDLNDGRTIRLEQEVVFSSDVEQFHLAFDRRIKHNGELMREKQWKESFPRDFQ